MKITIDTQVDNREDIKKVIEILTHMIKDNNIVNNMETSSHNTNYGSSQNSNNMMNMFNVGFEDTSKPIKEFVDNHKELVGSNSNENQTNRIDNEYSSPDFSNFLKLVDNKEVNKEDKKEPKIEFF